MNNTFKKHLVLQYQNTLQGYFLKKNQNNIILINLNQQTQFILN